MSKRQIIEKRRTNLIEFLKSVSDFVSYEQVATWLGTKPRGVGSMLRALAKRGFADLCAKVIYKRELVSL